MKVSLVILAVMIAQASSMMTRIYCNTSGITVVKPLCQLKLTSRNSSYLNFGGEVVKEVRVLRASASWHFKNYRNWRQIMQTPEVELCQFLRSDNPQPFFKGFLDEIQNLLPSIPKQCPMNPGRYYTYNITVDDGVQQKPNVNDKYRTTTDMLPNGIYRITIKVSSTDDPDAIFIQWFNEIKRRMNDGNI